MLLLLKQQRVSNASSSSRTNVSVIATLSRSASMRSTGFVSKTISRYEHYSRFLYLSLLLLLLLLPCRSMLPSSNSSFPWTMSNSFERTAIPLIAPWFPQRIKPHHQPGFFRRPPPCCQVFHLGFLCFHDGSHTYPPYGRSHAERSGQC